MPVSTPLALAAAGLVAAAHPVRQDIVDKINAANAGWQAVAPINNKFKEMSEEEIVGIMGTILEAPRDSSNAPVGDFPAEFDARTAFASCKHPIRNQLKCGSCWAFSSAETWNDNACIQGLTPNTTVLSTEEILACATFGSDGCGGGRINFAFNYIESDGLVTEGCFPYTSQNGTVSKCPPEIGPSERTCPAAGEEWKAIQCNGKSNDLWTPALMKAGIMQLGSVATGYTVFEDFMSYKSGIYRHVTGKELGGHAIKVVGWGVQNATATEPETPYWIVANSWGPEWGEEGYFRFSMLDTACHFGEGGSYNCGKFIPPPGY